MSRLDGKVANSNGIFWRCACRSDTHKYRCDILRHMVRFEASLPALQLALACILPKRFDASVGGVSWRCLFRFCISLYVAFCCVLSRLGWSALSRSRMVRFGTVYYVPLCPATLCRIAFCGVTSVAVCDIQRGHFLPLCATGS